MDEYSSLFATLPWEFRRAPNDPRLEPPDPWWHAWKAQVVAAYAWAVPGTEAIPIVLAHAPRLVEIGAGSGYWARTLAQSGADIVAYDAHPHAARWWPVLHGGPEVAARHPDRALFLCWPPYGVNMASAALAAYRGTTVVYAGEWRLGCAEPSFFTALEMDWKHVAGASLQNWRGRFDALAVFQRRAGGEIDPLRTCR